jgi:hypothetical protein
VGRVAERDARTDARERDVHARSAITLRFTTLSARSPRERGGVRRLNPRPKPATERSAQGRGSATPTRLTAQRYQPLEQD